jgi:hypothetical protein
MDEAVFTDGFLSVMTATRRKPAAHAHLSIERRQGGLVEVNAADGGGGRPLF